MFGNAVKWASDFWGPAPPTFESRIATCVKWHDGLVQFNKETDYRRRRIGIASREEFKRIELSEHDYR